MELVYINFQCNKFHSIHHIIACFDFLHTRYNRIFGWLNQFYCVLAPCSFNLLNRKVRAKIITISNIHWLCIDSHFSSTPYLFVNKLLLLFFLSVYMCVSLYSFLLTIFTTLVIACSVWDVCACFFYQWIYYTKAQFIFPLVFHHYIFF